ncbi:MAG: hypothetical protein R3C14_42925 [Caldilineaceae bacterium]
MLTETKSQLLTTSRITIADPIPAIPTNHVRRWWQLPPTALIVLLYLALALFGERIAPYRYTEQHFSDTL